MNKKVPFIISLTIHIIMFITIILFFPKEEVKIKEEKIKVELVYQKEEKPVEKRPFKENNVDIIDNTVVYEVSTKLPTKETYIDEVSFNEPDLVILSTYESETTKNTNTTFNKDSFEDSLEDLMPVIDMGEVSENDESLIISWNGDKRDFIHNSQIDFSKFPEDTFTGVGVKVEFMVNPVGEVFNVNIIPPGSGSIDFDILIKQYVLKFKFNPSKINSRGEVLIVYKK